jgi:hypothetical protein
VVARPRASRAARAAGRLRRRFATPTSRRADLPARPSEMTGRTARISTQRLNQPRAVVVEARVDGSPARVNRQRVAVVREEWRVVDRWWTEEPVSRRYFEVVLETGENTVVFRDEEAGRWFSQRGV